MNIPSIRLTPQTILIGVGGVTALLVVVVLVVTITILLSDQQSVQVLMEPVTETDESVVRSPEGVSDDVVLFGQSAALSGPARDLGWGMRRGIEAAFHEVNLEGGIHGRRLELVTLDDTYEPESAIVNTVELIEDRGVFALIGGVGSPTSRSAIPIAEAAGVPYVAPLTGADFLRAPGLQYVVNLRASYDQEAEEMVARLTGELGIERIAVMYQDDSFGRAGFRGVRDALDRRGLKLAATGLYPRNTTAVKSALLDLQSGQPDAVILVGAYEPVAALISWARTTGMDTVFITLSFAGSNTLIRELGPHGPGVFITQIVPSPYDPSIPAVGSYSRALSEVDPKAEPDFVSFEGYLAGRLAIAGLQGCGPTVTRMCFLEGMRAVKTIGIDGFELNFGTDDNQGSDSVFLNVIGTDGQFHAIESLRDAAP